jgi:hypothetical protein
VSAAAEAGHAAALDAAERHLELGLFEGRAELERQHENLMERRDSAVPRSDSAPEQAASN